mgnify:CR=1 FL=1
MGMFDTIAWGEKLPFSKEMKELGLNKSDWEFQTKDLDNVLSVYFVQNKKLFLQKYKINEWVEGDSKAKHLTDRLGYLRRDEPYLELAAVTCSIRMYDHRYDVQDKWDCWIEYEANFVKGKLKSVKLSKFEKTDNAERRARDEEFRKQYARETGLWYNRFIFYTRPWRLISRYLRRFTIASSELLYSISNKIP